MNPRPRPPPCSPAATNVAGGADRGSPPTALLRTPRSCGCETRWPRLGVVAEQRVRLVREEPLTAFKERQLDQEPAPNDLPPEPFDQLAQRLCRPAGGQQIIMDEHARAAVQRIRVQLELAG